MVTTRPPSLQHRCWQVLSRSIDPMTSAQVARKVREPVVEKVNKALLNARQKHGAVKNVATTTGQPPLWIAVANVSVPRDGRAHRTGVQSERKSPERPLPPMAPCLLAEVWR